MCILVNSTRRLLDFGICAVGRDGEAHGAVLKQEMNAGTWCMDRNIVTGPFPFRNSATGK